MPNMEIQEADFITDFVHLYNSMHCIKDMWIFDVWA